ncbi:hypothetical protein [Duganella radicis]|uniref:DUF3828 domain-containing protein n=1 Tax=Duganella radicis TaxID=551988 RepID=A0A6L6PNU5_9BURK|nr:hypothetical protein [Duganella radicis]MTV40806.1 hypothetical protein [Duganella radicis]
MKRIYVPYLALAMLATSGIACAQKPGPTLRTLTIQGDEYASACTPKNKTVLEGLIRAEARKAASVADAWPLIDTLLCQAKAPDSRAFIAGRLNKTVSEASTSSGGPDALTRTKVDAELIDSLLSEGEAWNADLRFAKNEITLRFMSDEACVRSRKLQLNKGKWQIAQIGEACD